MNVYHRHPSLRAVLLFVSLLIPVLASAHLMPAQKGTLNVTEKGIFMVLSVPATAFAFADTNNDELLSNDEFILARSSIIQAIENKVTMHDKDNNYAIDSLMLTPVSDHPENKQAHSNTDKIMDHIVVMGRFNPSMIQESMTFRMGLFGRNEKERTFSMTSKFKARDLENNFKVTVDRPESALFPVTAF